MTTVKKTIWELDLHESVWVNPSLTVRRVPGGWLYENYCTRQLIDSYGDTRYTDWEYVNSNFVAYVEELK